MSQLTSVPEMVGGVDYMKLYSNRCYKYHHSYLPKAYKSLYHYEPDIQQENQREKPNVDWYNEMFNKNAFAQRFNFNIRGGKKAVTYFMSASVKAEINYRL